MYYISGQHGNLLGRATVTATPAAAALFPVTNAYDGDPSSPFYWGSNAADCRVAADLQALTNGGFETSTLSGWTSSSAGTGTSAETTTAGEFRTGAKALKLTGTDASNYGARYQDITVRAGEYRKHTVYVKAITSGTGKVYIRNLRTGKYYNGSAWAASGSAGSSSVTSFTAVPITYQVEDLDTCQSDTVTLRITYACESGTATFDDGLDVPGVSWVSIHGHNLGPVVPTVRSSDDDSAYTDRGTITIKRPACYVAFSIIYAQYWRVVMVGTNHETGYLGEIVVGQQATSATAPQWGLSETAEFYGIRNRAPGGRILAASLAVDPARSISFQFSARSEAAMSEIVNGIWRRSQQGVYPVIVAPITTEGHVIHGRALEPQARERPFQGVHDLALTVAEDSLPVVGL